MIQIVSYDLKSPNNSSWNYQKVEVAIASVGQCTRIEDSVWLVQSAFPSEATFRAIEAAMSPEDRLFVAALTPDILSVNLEHGSEGWIVAAQANGLI